jgi:drug/metabolite transporter (DMT)-like permease
VENILAKKVLPEVDPDIVVAARMVIGAVVLLAATALTIPQALHSGVHLQPSQWLWLCLTIILLFGYVMSWYRALKLAPAITVTVILIASTLVTNVLSAIFTTHAWTISMGLQAGLTLAGITIFWLSIKKEVARMADLPNAAMADPN